MNKPMEPTLHKPVPMGTRVKVQAGYVKPEAVTGTVIGVSFMHVVFGDIVLLDHEIDTEFGIQRGVSVIGTALESEDGLTHWRLSQ